MNHVATLKRQHQNYNNFYFLVCVLGDVLSEGSTCCPNHSIKTLKFRHVLSAVLDTITPAPTHARAWNLLFFMQSTEWVEVKLSTAAVLCERRNTLQSFFKTTGGECFIFKSDFGWSVNASSCFFLETELWQTLRRVCQSCWDQNCCKCTMREMVSPVRLDV